MKYITRAPMLRANTSTTWGKKKKKNIVYRTNKSFRVNQFRDGRSVSDLYSVKENSTS